MLSQMPQTVSRYALMSRRPRYEPMTDFTHIIRLTGYLFGVVVRADAPWWDFEAFVAHAKTNPGRATYGTSGVGSTLHVVMERIAGLEGTEWTHVPFGGSAPNMQSLLAGQTDAKADGATWAPLVEDGRLRCLCPWGAARARRFPDVPNLRDRGILRTRRSTASGALSISPRKRTSPSRPAAARATEIFSFEVSRPT
jgi:tripartite-type tricarboxylate transporter receptor subunit TctC